VSRDVLPALRVTNPGAFSVVDPWNFFDYNLTYRDGARRFEPSGHNPLAFAATRAMLSMFIGLGGEFIHKRVLALTDRLADGLAKKGHTLLSPRGENEKSGIITFAPAKQPSEVLSAKLTEIRCIHTHRGGAIRLSPHFYNTEDEVERVLEVL
jgi:selenocysteine lyase/cysteine desulfurase